MVTYNPILQSFKYNHMDIGLFLQVLKYLIKKLWYWSAVSNINYINCSTISNSLITSLIIYNMRFSSYMCPSIFYNFLSWNTSNSRAISKPQMPKFPNYVKVFIIPIVLSPPIIKYRHCSGTYTPPNALLCSYQHWPCPLQLSKHHFQA